jgi:hypothetical protein
MGVLLAIALVSCSGADSYYLEHYGSVVPQEVRMQNDTFYVIDVVEEKRILVQHERERKYDCRSDSRYELAAQTHFDNTNRSCTIEDAQCVPTHGLEFFYACTP